ncbi:MAG: hypothetical protein KC925_01795 [Candidatus Doudnabacteria bacterium]|nr:hypothetical protein [Candidatus Doudnabacteria bacterium]
MQPTCCRIVAMTTTLLTCLVSIPQHANADWPVDSVVRPILVIDLGPDWYGIGVRPCGFVVPTVNLVGPGKTVLHAKACWSDETWYLGAGLGAQIAWHDNLNAEGEPTRAGGLVLEASWRVTDELQIAGGWEPYFNSQSFMRGEIDWSPFWWMPTMRAAYEGFGDGKSGRGHDLDLGVVIPIQDVVIAATTGPSWQPEPGNPKEHRDAVNQLKIKLIWLLGKP